MFDETVNRKKNQFRLVAEHISSDKLWFILLIFAVSLVVVNCLRLDWNIFWGDEVYSIGVAKMSYWEIIDYGATIDSHPPLYNLMLHTCCLLFGHNVVTYNLAPLIAFLGIAILTLTSVYRYFGKITSFSLLILSAALTSAFFYASESRMYELGAFLILATFIQLYKVLTFGRKRDYVWFSICAIAAAYTHYYCVIAVAFFYLVLLIDPLIKKNGKFKKSLLVSVIAIISYIPWILFAFIHTFSRDSNNFWISETMSFKECCEYLFYADNGMEIFAVFVILVTILLVTNILKVSKEHKGVWGTIRNLDPETTWVIAGLLSIFGTIAVGLIVSAVLRPLIYPRYLYPMTIIAWMLFSLGLSRADLKKAKRVIPVLLLALLLAIGIPNIHSSFDNESEQASSCDRICGSTNGILTGGDVIITDYGHLCNNVLKYYYPDTEEKMMDKDIAKTLNPSKHYVLYLSNSVDDDTVKRFHDQNYDLKLIDEGSFAKTYYVHVYDVQRI